MLLGTIAVFVIFITVIGPECVISTLTCPVLISSCFLEITAHSSKTLKLLSKRVVAEAK